MRSMARTVVRTVKHVVVAAIGFAALVITPYFLYSGGGDGAGGGGPVAGNGDVLEGEHAGKRAYEARQFRYGAEELRAMIEGTWELQVTADQGAPRVYTLVFEQATAATASRVPTTGAAGGRGRGLIRRAEACAQRTLVRSAAACLDTTTMPLTVRIAEAGGVPVLAPNRVDARLRVLGLELRQASLDLRVDKRFVSASIDPSGDVVIATMHEGTAKLRRVAVTR